MTWLASQLESINRSLGARGRRIVHTGVWSLIAKLAAAANLFLTIPFVLQALGPTKFGIWATLVSLVTFVGFLDFGLGNGAMNLVAAAHGQGKDDEVGPIVYEANRSLLFIALCFASVSILVLPFVPWNRLLGAPDSLSTNTSVSVAAVFLAVTIAIPLNLAARVQLGLGRGNLAFRWQAIGQALTACVVILLAKLSTRLDVLVAASLLTPLVASAANNFQLRRSLHPRQSSNVLRNQEISRAIRKDGALFFCLQLAAALAFSADLPLISAIQGPEIAGKYAIVQRMFAVIPMALALVWAPLWPIYRQALSVSDRDWVQRTLSWSTAAAVSIAALAGLTLVLGFNQLSALWLGQTFSPSLLLLWGFAAWSIFDALGTSLATLLNAAGVLRFQVAIACAFAVTCVAGKVIVIFLSGVELMPWITLVSWLTCALLPLLLFRRQLISQVFSNSQMETS